MFNYNNVADSRHIPLSFRRDASSLVSQLEHRRRYNVGRRLIPDPMRSIRSRQIE